MKDKFLRNEFLTMSVLGAMGRSRTYTDSATQKQRDDFRNALRDELDRLSRRYESAVLEDGHFSNIERLSADLSSQFADCDCLRNKRFRIGIAQKALNLYLKYLWCVDIIPLPPHCPFDSIVINLLPNCRGLSWTSFDTIEDYKRLVKAARIVADGESLAEWERAIWLRSVQQQRGGK